MLLMHVVFVGAVFLLDPTLDRRIREEPWYETILARFPLTKAPFPLEFKLSFRVPRLSLDFG